MNKIKKDYYRAICLFLAIVFRYSDGVFISPITAWRVAAGIWLNKYCQENQ